MFLWLPWQLESNLKCQSRKQFLECFVHICIKIVTFFFFILNVTLAKFGSMSQNNIEKLAVWDSEFSGLKYQCGNTILSTNEISIFPKLMAFEYHCIH